MATDDPELAELAGETLELADVLNTALDKGVVLHGDVTIAIADIDLVKLNLGLLLGAIDTVNRHLGESAREPDGAVDSGTPAGDAACVSPIPPATPRSLAAAFGPPRLDPIPHTSVPRGAVPVASAATSVATPVITAPATPRGDTRSHPETSLNAVAQGLPSRINAEASGIESGLARLVLTLIEVLRKVLEHQAIRRMDGGRLSAGEIERLGLALSRLNDRMQELKNVFGLTDDDLQIDLGPLGRVR